MKVRHGAYLAWPTTDAWPVIVKWAVVLTVAFALSFYGADVLSQRLPWHVRVDTPWDACIPFVPQAVWLYLSLNLTFAGIPFVVRRLDHLFALNGVLVLQMMIAAMFFIGLPVVSRDVPAAPEGILGLALHVADLINGEQNYFPSLHVTFAITCTWVFGRTARWRGRVVLSTWCSLIVLSTLLLHQHYISDVIGGAALAFVTIRWLHPFLLDRFSPQVDALVTRGEE